MQVDLTFFFSTFSFITDYVKDLTVQLLLLPHKTYHVFIILMWGTFMLKMKVNPFAKMLHLRKKKKLLLMKGKTFSLNISGKKCEKKTFLF